NGDNSSPQQLQKVDLQALGTSAQGTNLRLTAHPGPRGGNGLVNVGFLEAAGVDLQEVVVQGDLGRIHAGDDDLATPGLASLAVDSLGRFGTATQPADGSLTSVIQGQLGLLLVRHDVTAATIAVAGQIGNARIGGSLIGGSEPNSGALVSTGDMGPV